jgi:hypothetical protein
VSRRHLAACLDVRDVAADEALVQLAGAWKGAGAGAGAGEEVGGGGR